MSDPRLKDVARNMVVALDALTGTPEAGRELAAFYALATDVTWSGLRSRYLDLASDLPEDPTWCLSNDVEERPEILGRARKLHAVIEAREDPRSSYLSVADANLWAPDSLRSGKWVDPEVLTRDRLHSVAQQTARRHLGHLERFEELDYSAMVEALSGALEELLGAASGRFSIGALGYRNEEDSQWILPLTTDVGEYRVFLQLKLWSDTSVTRGFQAYLRSDRTTSSSDLRALSNDLTPEQARVLFSGSDEAEEIINEHACSPAV